MQKLGPALKIETHRLLLDQGLTEHARVVVCGRFGVKQL